MEMTAAQKRVVDSIIEAAGIDADVKVTASRKGSSIVEFRVQSELRFCEDHIGWVGPRGGCEYLSRAGGFGQYRKQTKLGILLKHLKHIARLSEMNLAAKAAGATVA